jgi:hypothetical protein
LSTKELAQRESKEDNARDESEDDSSRIKQITYNNVRTQEDNTDIEKLRVQCDSLLKTFGKINTVPDKRA